MTPPPIIERPGANGTDLTQAALAESHCPTLRVEASANDFVAQASVSVGPAVASAAEMAAAS